MRNVRIVFWLALAVVFASQPSFAPAQDTAPRVTFSETIAPILYEHCITCHRPGEIGPFPLISYDDAAKRGAKIRDVTASRYMPPWHPAHGFGSFVGERRLSDEQIAAIGAWVEQGMPRGDRARMPPLPPSNGGWQLGKPDLVLEMAAPFAVPAHAHDIYRNFVLPTGLKENKWVRAVELHSNARSAAHHALFGYVKQGSFAARDGADGQPGFGGSMAVGFVPGQDGGSLGGWAVGGRGLALPDGLALPLPAGSDFLLQMHFHSMGEAARERAQVGLYFADGPPPRPLASLHLPALFGFGAGIDIPAGESSYVMRDSFTLPGDVLAHAAWAHAHYLGKELKLEATLPDGSKAPLLWIPDWDFNWQEFYSYQQPVRLPKGTRVDAMIRYDNSAGNRRNPHDPPEEVRWGLHSTDEMGTIGLLLEIAAGADEAAVGEALGARTREAIQRGAADGTLQRYLAEQAAPDGGAN
jgi:mono/diheme cytochrome c family protein